MDRLVKIFGLIICFFINNPLACQENTKKEIIEDIHIITNTNVLIIGETLFYNINTFDFHENKVLDFSKIAYVELYDNNNVLIFKHKIFLEKGFGFGDFFIPTNLKTGNYNLIFYTNFIIARNLPIKSKTIKIINPNDVIIKDINNEINQNSINQTHTLDLNYQIYNKRSIVNLELNELNKYKKGNISVSIRKKDSLELLETINKKAVKYITKKQNFYPEHRGEIITGFITSKTQNFKIDNIDITLSINGSNNLTKITKSDKEGNFIFLLDKKNTNNNLVFQICDKNKENYKITINETENIHLLDEKNLDTLYITKHLKNSVRQRYIASQIENSYYQVKKDSSLSEIQTQPFYNIAETKEYILDNYTRFYTLKETIIEVIDGLYFKKNNANYSLHLKDYDEFSAIDLPCMILVDGLFIQNINELMNHKSEIFKKINLYKGGYYLGTKLFNGILAFTTKENNYQHTLVDDYMVKPNLLRPLVSKKYFQPEYFNQNSNKRIPDYRLQLAWYPNINFDENNKNLKFYTSDIPGFYEVKIDGYSESGEEIKFSKKILVE